MANPYLIGTAQSAASSATLVLTAGSAGGSGTASGDAIVVTAANSGATAVTGVTDSKSNTYTQKQSTATQVGQSMWVADKSNNGSGPAALVSGTDTITITYGATNTNSKTAVAGGVTGYSVTDVTPTPTSNAGSTTPSIASGTLAQANEVIFVSFGNGNGGGTPSGLTNCTSLGTASGSAAEFLTLAYDVVASTASVTTSCTIVSSKWSALLLSLKAPLGTDTGSGADAGSLAAALAGADTAAGADAGSVSAAFSGADTGSAAESASVAVVATFPQAPLPAELDLMIGGAWTNVTSYALQRDGGPIPVMQRGRPDETSTASPQTLAGQLNNRDGRFTPRNPTGAYYGDLPLKNTPVRYGIGGATPYLRFADDAVSYASTPDAAGLQITGDIDIRILARLDDHRACCLASKWSSVSGAWALLLNGDGTLSLFWGGGPVDGVQSTAGLAVPLGKVLIRATLAVASGTVTFYTGSAMGTGTQLGLAVVSGSTSVPAAAGQPVAVGYSAEIATLLGVNGCLGAVHEFQLLSGIAGTLKADPVFTSQTAGAASFADAQGNTWSVAGTAEISATSWRFHGETWSLPQAWDTSGADVWSPFSAAGMQRRMVQQQRPVFSALRRAIPALLPALEAYWPGEDGAGATQIASATPGVRPMAIQGSPNLAASPAFTGSAPLPQPNGASITGSVPAYAAGTVQTVLVAVDPTSADGAGAGSDVLTIALNGTVTMIILSTQGGAFGAQFVNATTNLATLVGSGTYTGQPVLIRITVNCALIPAQAQMEILVAGQSASAETVTATFAGSTGAVSSVTTAPVNLPALTTSATGHWAVVNGPVALASLAPALNAYQGETAGTRFARLCGENNLGCRIYGYPDLSAAMGPQTVATLATLLQECESADQGIIFESRRALALGYRTLKSLVNQAAAVTLDYAGAYIGDGSGSQMVPADDDAHLVNDVTASRGSASGSAGSSYTVALGDGSPMSVSPPPAGAGDYQSTPSVNVASDSQLASWAGWREHVGTSNEERYPQVPLNLARSQLASIRYDIAGLDIGDRIDIINPPAWLPPGPIRQLLYGYAETAGGFRWAWSPNLVPESPYEVGTAGDATYGHAQTDGAVLHASCSSGAATITVDSSGLLFSTAVADVPFDIIVGPFAGLGEQMTVTAVSATTNPQTLTVSRAVNGVVMAHSAGDQVRLRYPSVAAVA